MSGAQHQNCRAGNIQAFTIAAKCVQLEKSSPIVTGKSGNDKTYQEMTVAPAKTKPELAALMVAPVTLLLESLKATERMMLLLAPMMLQLMITLVVNSQLCRVKYFPLFKSSVKPPIQRFLWKMQPC